MKKHLSYILLLIFSLILVSCSGTTRYTAKNESSPRTKKVEREYPKENNNNLSEYNNAKPIETVTGIASYYGKKFNGKKTSNGETFDMYGLTAAHKTFPFGTIIRVVDLKNGNTVIVRVNDRMPTYNGRLIDLSYGAAKELGMLTDGIAEVRLEILKWGK